MPTPAAPVITNVGPNSNNAGMLVSYTYDTTNTTKIAAEVDLFNAVATPFTHGATGQRFVRGYGDPPTYVNAGFLGLSPLVDFEAPRETEVYYRLRSWNFSGGIWTPSAYSNIASGYLPVLRQAWLKDPFASIPLGTGDGSIPGQTTKITIEGTELKYPGESRAEAHFALGRADPILVSDSVMYQSPQVPPGYYSHFPIIQVPFFIHDEDGLYTVRQLVANPVRPVLVQTGFGSAASITGSGDFSEAHQFYGQMVRSEITALTTGQHQQKNIANTNDPPGGPVPPGVHAAWKIVNFYRAVIDFQTVRRPPDRLA